MLDSVKLQRRQSEIRQALSGLVAKDQPTEDEIRSMETLDGEYRTNETRYRAALVAEDSERRAAGADLETRGDRKWADLVAGFEVRQVTRALDEGRPLEGKTAEVVAEMRASGSYRGIPIPLAALEVRAGETIASGTPDPIVTKPIVDRIFAAGVAAKMGVQVVDIPSGALEFPIATSGASAGWAGSELGSVPGPQVFATTDKALKPEHNLGVQMKVSRKALLQSGPGLEDAIRRDMSGAILTELDRAVFLGSGSSGEPTGLIPGAGGYGISVTDLDDPASWAMFRAAVAAFMGANLANSPADVRILLRPEAWAYLDGALVPSTAVSEWDRLSKAVPSIVTTSNALAAPAGDPSAVTAVLTTTAGGVPPAWLGIWGGVDLIRDPYSDAASGALRLTGILTADVQVSRPAQTRILTGVELEADEEA